MRRRARTVCTPPVRDARNCAASAARAELTVAARRTNAMTRRITDSQSS